MPKKDWRQIVGMVVIAVVVLGLGVVIYFVVSGKWGTKRFRGIEKFRGDRIEQLDRSASYAYVHRLQDRKIV